MNTPAYPALSPDEVSVLDAMARALIDDGYVEWGWVLCGIVDKCDELTGYVPPFLYRQEYDEGYTATAEEAREVLEHYDNQDLYEARQALGHIAERADEARDAFEDTAADREYKEGTADREYKEGTADGWEW